MNFFKRLFSSKKSNTPIGISPEKRIENFICLAEALVENDNPEIIEKYKKKLSQLKSNPELIFNGGEYFYDTLNYKLEALRGDIK